MGSSLLLCAIALLGGLTVLLREQTVKRLLLPLVALSAGSLLGGALFHMMPAAVESLGNGPRTYAWIGAGFMAMFVLEQFLRWHHCHGSRSDHDHQPVTYLLLAAGGLHKFLAGVVVGAAFVLDIRLGFVTLLAEAAHEVPQELGDFGVLVHAGWSARRALAYNLACALTFPVGGLLTYAAAGAVDVAPLVPFAAGNFVYIAAADLVPEINRHEKLGKSLLHMVTFVGGLGALLAARLAFGH